MSLEIPPEVLEAFALEGATWTPIESGWINLTLLVERDGERSILQRLHPIFSGEVNRDIDAIGAHLVARGVAVPRIVRTRSGALFVDAERPWRMLTFLEGESRASLSEPALARSAGALVGRFHAALVGLDHTFAFTRPGAHDTAAHLEKLRALLADGGPEGAAEVAEAILAHPLPPLPPLPRRIVHGDLKATNLLFEGERAVALLDLDTLAHGTIAVEMGDALRSWCNPAGESDPGAAFDAEIFEAALEGYAEHAASFLEEAEAGALVAGAETIAVELASRFCADVYEDRYFRFDASRFESRRAHNLARARAQLALARSIRDQRPRLEAIAARALAR